MKQNQTDRTRDKEVKFKMSDSEDEERLSEASKLDNKSIVYSTVDSAKSFALKTFNECDSLFRVITEDDPFAKKSDTVSGIVMILKKLKGVLELLNKAPQSDKEELFHLVYNCSLYIFDYCRVLRKSIYGLLCITYLKEILIGMESNIVLLKSKYLEWRCKIYIELIRIYEENGSLKCALELASRAASTIKKQKDLEELDPPVPEYSKKIYQKCQHYLNSLTIKFQVQLGEMKIDVLKNKIKELFPKEEDNRDKMLTLIEVLTINNKNYNVFQHDGKKDAWKDQVVDLVYDLVKNDLAFLTSYLERKFNELKDKSDFPATIRAKKEGEQLDLMKSTQATRLTLLEQEEKAKKISMDFPLELHFELMKHAFDIQKTAVFTDLLSHAFKRCDFRRLEVPYIADIDFEISNDMDVNVRNGYEKIPIDLNEAYLKQEIAKLRNKKQETTEEDDSKTVSNKAKPPPKAPGKKGAEIEEVLDGQNIQTHTGFKMTKKELEKVEHQFTYMVMKKTSSPKEAIYNLEVVIANEHTGPTDYVKKGWKCIDIPIQQYTGIRATYHTVPYICFQQSADKLKNENEKKTVLSDIKPIISRSPFIRPDYGYQKINVDLRQVPTEFIKLNNIDYVFLSFKTDAKFYSTEKLCYIFDNINRLEQTLNKNKINNEVDEAKILLMANFGYTEFQELAQNLKEALKGPLGEQLLVEEYDLLFKISFHIWKTYISPIIVQIEHFYYLRSQEEILGQDVPNFQKIITEHLQPAFIDLLQIFLKVVSSNEYEQDILWICKMGLELGKLLEEQKRFKEASQILRNVFDKVTNYRDEKLQRRLKSELDLLLPFSITCNNNSIGEMIEGMRTRYFSWKLGLERTIRRIRRSKAGKHTLKQAEEDEEEDEVLRYTKQFHNDDFKDEAFFDKISKRQIEDFDLLVNALHVDVCISMFRNELKEGAQREEKKADKTKAIKDSVKDDIELIKEQAALQGIADNIIKKINILKEPHSKEMERRNQALQMNLGGHGLRERGNLSLEKYETSFLREASNNIYLKAILYMLLAMNKSSRSDQDTLLSESLNNADKMEQGLIKEGIKNSPEILSTLFEDKLTRTNSDKVHPFSAMIKEEYIEKTKAPRTPILLCKTSHSMIFKLPCFRPKIPEEILLHDPKKGVITSMALFGKTTDTTAVSVTSTELSNTGIHYPMNSIVRIPNLPANSTYSFAVAAYDMEENLSNQIGETTQPIHNSQPMPINLLYSYLCKISFQMDFYSISYKAAEHALSGIIEKSAIREKLVGDEFHPVLTYRIVPKRLKQISGLEMRAGAESLLIWSYCSHTDLDKKRGEPRNPNIRIDKQKQRLEICNLLLLSLEMSIPCQGYDIARVVIIEIYNNLEEFFQMKTLSRLIFQVLSKCNIGLSLIPPHYWDDLLRKVSAKIGYQLVRLALQLNEFFFSKRILYTEIRIPRRRYNLKAGIEMVEFVDPAKAKKGPAKPAAGKKGAEVEEEEKKMVPQFVRDIVERNTYQPFFEEFLLTIHEDYYNFTDYFQDYWIEHLNNLSDKVTTDEKINQSRQDLNRIVEFYSLFFDVANMKQKIDESSKQTERFLEYLSKLGRRLIEINYDNASTKDIKSKLEGYKTNRKPDETNELVDNYIKLKFRAYDGNIDWNPSGLNSLIRDEETNQTGNRQAIDIFTDYFDVQDKLITHMEKNWRSFRFIHLWNSEIAYLTGVSYYLAFKQNRTNSRPTPIISPCDIFELDRVDTQAAIKKDKNVQQNVSGDKSERGQNESIPLDNRSGAISARSNTSRELNTVLKTFPEDKEFTDSQLAELDKVFEFLAIAAVEALVSRCYRQLQNIAVYAHNLLVDEVIRPIEIAKRDLAWKHLVLLVDSCLKMVEDIKNTRSFYDNDEVNVLESKPFNAQFFKVVRDDDKGLTPLDPLDEKKKFWFQDVKALRIQIIADLVGFVTQVLMINEKWNVLINVTKTLSNVTSHYFSKYTLPFTIGAQEVLYQGATEKTKAKLEEMNTRIEQHQHWLKTKKEKSRQLRIKNEKTEEELKFDRDVAALKTQIDLCKLKEKLYKSDMEEASLIKTEIDSEIKDSIKELRSFQRNLAQYASSDRKICEAIRLRIVNENDVNRKGLLNEANNYIRACKSLIDNQMKKNKDNSFYEVVALHDLANLCYSIGDFKQAATYWGECVDKVFEKFNSIKGFRELSLGSVESVHRYGMKELLIVIIVLGKLAIYIHHKDISLRRECTLMACAVASDLLKVSLEHPQSINDLSVYSLSRLGEEDLFNERKNLDANDLLYYSSQLSSLAVDLEMYFQAIPLICLSEYLANHECNSFFHSAKAKLLKSISLSSTGLINESIVNLLRVFHEKDFPIMSLLKNSENLKLKIGVNYSFMQDMQYQNDVTPNDVRNTNIITKIMDMKLTEVQFFRFGPVISQLFNYAKTCLLFSMLRLENLDTANFIDFRRGKLDQVQQKVIENIKRLIFEEKLAIILTASDLKPSSSQSAEPVLPGGAVNNTDDSSKGLSQKEASMAATFFVTSSEYSESKDQYLKAFTSDSQLTFEESRRERTTLLVSNYILLSKISRALNSFSRTYLYLRDCINILHKLACESVKIEFSELPEVEEPADPKDKKKKAEKDDKKAVKKDVKKPAAGAKKPGKDGKVVEEEMGEDEFTLFITNLEEMLERLPHETGFQRGVQVHLWMMLKHEIANTLYYMKRWSCLNDLIESISEDSSKVNDQFFKRKSLELKCRALIIAGKKKEAKDLMKVIQDMGEKNNDKDISFAIFFSDMGEFYFHEKEYETALEMFKKGKAIFLKYLRNYVYEFEFSNINQHFANEKICSELLENKYDIEQKLGRERIEKGGKGGKGGDNKSKKKDDKKPGQKDAGNVNSDIGTLFPMSVIQPLKDQKITLIQPDEQQDQPINSSTEYICIYAPELELYTKLNQRIVHTLLTIKKLEQNDPTITTRSPEIQDIISQMKKIMGENNYILRKNYFISVSIKSYNEFLQSRIVKFEALFKFIHKQSQLIEDHLNNEKSSAVKRILEHLPYKTFSLNKYILEVPMFTKFLREEFLPLLEKSKESLLRSLGFLKGENVLQEFDFAVSDIMMEIADTNLLIAEYRPRLKYRLVSNDDIRQYGLIKNHKTLLQDHSIYDKIEVERKKDSDLQNYLIWEAFEYIKNSITASRIVERFREDYNKLGEEPDDFVDASKMNKDISEEILEARRLAESEKPLKNPFPRTKISKVDLITYLLKLYQECKIFSFQNNFAQKQIIKLHKFLVANLKSYVNEYPVDNFEVKLNSLGSGADGTGKSLPLRHLAVKGRVDPVRDEYSFMYILAKPDETLINQAKAKFPSEAEFNAFMQQSFGPLYGCFHASKAKVEKFLLDLLELKKQMIVSNGKKEEAKARDYKLHELKLLELIRGIGLLFHAKADPYKVAKESFKSEKVSDEEFDVFGKAIAFFPKVEERTVTTLIKIFSGLGVCEDNNDILMLFRHFHTLKYKFNATPRPLGNK